MTFAQTDKEEFMTPRDLLLDNATSNINLRNNKSTAVATYGIYVRQFAYVAPGGSCNNPLGVMYASTDNVTAGSLVMPITIDPGKSVAIGSNYLYNMIFEALYYVILGSTPPVCQLPGCTWGTDSAIYNWCIYLGALAPVSVPSFMTSNVPPSTFSASGVGFDYNLINNFVTLGPISCDDKALTCTTSTQQTQPLS